MEFGFDIPNMHHGLGLEAYVGGASIKRLAIGPETFDRLTARAEEIGFHTLWIADHIVFPDTSSVAHPLNYQPNTGNDDEPVGEGTKVRSADPIYEALSLLGFLGGRTSRCRLGIGILVIPYRNPVLMAKMLATIDVLTGGRVTVGAGVGWLKESFDAVGADYEHRGAVTDEFIDAMRVLWTADAPEIAGKHFTLPTGMRFLPKPIQRPIPILIGGSSPRALRRAAARGDGWIAPYQSLDQFVANRAKVLALVEGNGRDPATFQFVNQVRFQVLDEDGPTTDDFIGTPQRVAKLIRAFAEAGVDHLQLKPAPGPSTDSMIEQADRFAEQIVPLIDDIWQPAPLPAPRTYAR
ncbi:MAG: TIGR03619 family F420-dependent LLM class oxidoreductase [Acidimicrobiales bacterium]